MKRANYSTPVSPLRDPAVEPFVSSEFVTEASALEAPVSLSDGAYRFAIGKVSSILFIFFHYFFKLLILKEIKSEKCVAQVKIMSRLATNLVFLRLAPSESAKKPMHARKRRLTSIPTRDYYLKSNIHG